jgi:hypothetical protein
MGFDLYREHESIDGEQPVNDYFRWNIWGFPPIRFLAELYGWIPAGTIVQMEGEEEEECGYETNDGQTVSIEDAQNWANALKEAVKDLKPTGGSESGSFDDEFWVERKLIWAKDADAIKGWFSTKDDIEYIQQYITFLEGGSFIIC